MAAAATTIARLATITAIVAANRRLRHRGARSRSWAAAMPTTPIAQPRGRQVRRPFVAAIQATAQASTGTTMGSHVNECL